ncbi:AraC family transcriptional regulator, partial [Stenotrophomonas sp. HMWF022]
MRQLSLADRGQTVSLDKAIDDVAPTCMGVARLGSLQTAGTSFSVWMQVRGTSWVEAKEGRFRLRQGEWIAFEKESRPLVQAGRNGLCVGMNLN